VEERETRRDAEAYLITKVEGMGGAEIPVKMCRDDQLYLRARRDDGSGAGDFYETERKGIDSQTPCLFKI